MVYSTWKLYIYYRDTKRFYAIGFTQIYGAEKLNGNLENVEPVFSWQPLYIVSIYILHIYLGVSTAHTHKYISSRQMLGIHMDTK